MPYPSKGESQAEYLARFMTSAEARDDYPDQKQRAAVAYGLWERRNDEPLEEDETLAITNIINSLTGSARDFLLKNAREGKWPKIYQCRYIEPGLVNYAEYGNVLVQKPALDKMAQSFVGKPVINLIHKEVTPSMYANGEADGVVTRVWYNESDGWFWCDFIVWDESTMRNCESAAYSVSCAYTVSNLNGASGEYHNIAYEQEVLDGEYTHLAVVANPRYEGARIVYNSKGGTMKLFKLWKKGEAKNTAESDLEKAVVDVDGVKVPMQKLVEAHNSLEAKKAAATVENMSDETIVEVDGQELPLKNLKDSYRAVKNAEDEDDKKKKEKEDADRKNADDEAKKKKDEEDLKNADDAAKKKKEDDEKMENEKRFQDLKNASDRRGDPQQPKIVTRRELAAVGREKYGSTK